MFLIQIILLFNLVIFCFCFLFTVLYNVFNFNLMCNKQHLPVSLTILQEKKMFKIK